MRNIVSSNPLVVTGICDPNKSRARHHRSLKLMNSKTKIWSSYCSILYTFFSNQKITCIFRLFRQNNLILKVSKKNWIDLTHLRTSVTTSLSQRAPSTWVIFSFFLKLSCKYLIFWSKWSFDLLVYLVRPIKTMSSMEISSYLKCFWTIWIKSCLEYSESACFCLHLIPVI